MAKLLLRHRQPIRMILVAMAKLLLRHRQPIRMKMEAMTIIINIVNQRKR